MTLDEAIKHARDKANEQKYYASFERGKHIQSCKKCAEEHEQLASWLEELKDYRRFNGAKTFDNGFNQGEKYGYNKAIDDFIKKLEQHEHKNWVDHLEYGITWSDIEQITKELKDHKTLNIVHCKDCIHWGTGVAGETKNIKCCEYGKYMVGENGYCVYGVKECEE